MMAAGAACRRVMNEALEISGGAEPSTTTILDISQGWCEEENNDIWGHGYTLTCCVSCVELRKLLDKSHRTL